MKTIGVISGLVAVFLWGVIPILFKVGAETTPISFLLLVRFLVANVILMPVFFKFLKFKKHVTKIKWFYLFLSTAMSLICFSIALDGMSASVYIALYSVNPLATLLFLRSKITPKILLSLAVILIGVAAVLDFTNPFNSKTNIFDLFLLLCGMLSWAIYTKLIIEFQNTYDDSLNAAITHFLSLISMFLWWSYDGFVTVKMDSSFIGISIIFGFCSPVAFFCYSYCLRKVQTFGVLSQYLETLFGLLATRIVLNEMMSDIQLFGVFLIVFGTSLSLLGKGEHVAAKSNQQIGVTSP
jgi:drug/metabolite transporter (DMT)-like permease